MTCGAISSSFARAGRPSFAPPKSPPVAQACRRARPRRRARRASAGCEPLDGFVAREGGGFSFLLLGRQGDRRVLPASGFLGAGPRDLTYMSSPAASSPPRSRTSVADLSCGARRQRPSSTVRASPARRATAVGARARSARSRWRASSPRSDAFVAEGDAPRHARWRAAVEEIAGGLSGVCGRVELGACGDVEAVPKLALHLPGGAQAARALILALDEGRPRVDVESGRYRAVDRGWFNPVCLGPGEPWRVAEATPLRQWTWDRAGGVSWPRGSPLRPRDGDAQRADETA